MKTAALALLVCALAVAQQQHTLHGTVEEVNAATKHLSVANEPIPGGMGAMTMSYSVDKEDVLTRVKRGDRITAKWIEGESKLYDLQVAAGMRLDELERLALANSPTLLQVQAGVRASVGRAKQAGAYPNPTAGYYGDEIRGGSTGGGKQGAFVSQTIITGGKLRASRRVAELETKEAETNGEAQRLAVLNSVRMSFYRALAAQRMVEVRQNLATLAADAAQTSRQLANIGQADRPDVLQTEVEQQHLELNLRLAQQTLTAAWRMLSAAAGKPDLPQARLEGDLETLPELDYNEWLATALRDNPDVKFAQQAAARSNALLAQAKSVPIPDLQLYANLAQNNEPLETTRKPVGLNGGVQIGVQLPIFNRNQGGIAAAKDEIESAKQALAATKLRITRDVAAQFQDYENARATAGQYKKEMLPRAEQAYRLYQANYKNMAAAYPQTLMSQRTLFQLEVEYVQALENVWLSAVRIRGFGQELP